MIVTLPSFCAKPQKVAAKDPCLSGWLLLIQDAPIDNFKAATDNPFLYQSVRKSFPAKDRLTARLIRSLTFQVRPLVPFIHLSPIGRSKEL